MSFSLVITFSAGVGARPMGPAISSGFLLLFFFAFTVTFVVTSRVRIGNLRCESFHLLD